MDPSESIRMNVGELTVDPASKTPIVILRDEEERITLPIWIGAPEAHAIASELEGTRAARPQTHDLISSILDEAEVELLSVSICDLRENMYHAEISLRAAQKAFSVEARPSDAIALALRAKCEIRVAKHVLEQSSMVADEASDPESPDLSGVEPEKWSGILEDMKPDDFKYKM